MKKGILAILFAMVVVGSFTAPALANSPHFIGTPTIIKNSDFSIQASFKAAGLGNGIAAIFLDSSGGSATYQCVNNGGNVVQGKSPVAFGPLTGQKVDVTVSNGQVTATTGKLGPPPPPSASTACGTSGNGWKVVPLSVTYDDVTLHVQEPIGTDVLTFNFGTVTLPPFT